MEENHHIVTCTQTCLDFFKDLEKVLDDKDTNENIMEANDEFVGALTPLHRLAAQFLDVGRSSSSADVGLCCSKERWQQTL